MVPEDGQDQDGLRSTPKTGPAAVFAAASLIAASLPPIALLVLQSVTLDSRIVVITLIWLGIADTIAGIALGGLGRGATARGSDFRGLSTFGLVLGIIELVAILAFAMFVAAIGEATSGWGQM